MILTGQALMDAEMDASGTEVSITRSGGEATFDAVSGNLTPDAPVDVYSGPCLVNFVPTREQESMRGGEAEVQSRYQLTIPLGSGPVKLGDEAVITRNDADPQMIDTKMWVAQMPGGSGVSRRRLLCSSIRIAPR